MKRDPEGFEAEGRELDQKAILNHRAERGHKDQT
jgi:hypothetical protein